LNGKSSLKATDIGFKLGPRLNAVGRIGWAKNVVDLLTTTSPQRATELAGQLEQANEERQRIERRILAEAKELAEREGECPALVLASHEWHAGIIGIVASRLVEHYARPVLLISLNQDASGTRYLGQGSGRSVPGFPLHEALTECSSHLLRYGGHQAAAGFKVTFDKLQSFREQFTAIAARHFPKGPQPPQLTLDVEAPLNALTVSVVQDLDKLEPYGNQNRQPLFLTGGLKIVETPKCVGQGERHLRFKVKQEGTSLWCIGFGMADRLPDLMSQGGQCNLACRPQVNEWNGYRSVQLEVHDFQAGAQAALG
jgi:single-stranded-DNA-specific exonuclease